MSKAVKILLIAGAAILAFFLLRKKSSAAETNEEGQTPTGLQKAVGTVATLVGIAGAAVKTVASAAGIIGGTAAAGGAGAAAITTASVPSVIAPSTGIAAVAGEGGSTAVSGAASGLGTVAATVGLMAAPFILGPPLAKLLGGKTEAERVAEINLEFARQQAELDAYNKGTAALLADTLAGKEGSLAVPELNLGEAHY